ncbi:uncharacterized protein METZ01_LOCUS378247, partial [marine metagenome]
NNNSLHIDPTHRVLSIYFSIWQKNHHQYKDG